MSKQSIAIVDYGFGNLHSVAMATQYVAPNATVIISNNATTIANAERVIFPGQGAAKSAMQALKERQLLPVLYQALAEKPFLGICLGMQILMHSSLENDNTPCLAVFEGKTVPFAGYLPAGLKIPHMGWNKLQIKKHPLWHNIAADSYFYFVHSYFVTCAEQQIMATANYGEQFCAAIGKDNIFALQCHPEKSAAAGLIFLKNFVNWSP